MKKMINTSFKEYLIAKRNFIIILMCINSFALIVNVLEIKGSFKDGRCPKYMSHCLLTDGVGYYGENQYRQNFWPFVTFFESSDNYFYCDGGWESWHRKSFRGIFRYYDYSEFFLYSILILLGLYISWEVRRPK
jgi:hypothetical protein